MILPDGMTKINMSVFGYCYGMASVSIPASVTNMSAGGSFSSVYLLESLCIPDGVTTLGGFIFRECYSLKSAVLPDSLVGTGSQTFF
jgi:hypothetical protein